MLKRFENFVNEELSEENNNFQSHLEELIKNTLKQGELYEADINVKYSNYHKPSFIVEINMYEEIEKYIIQLDSELSDPDQYQHPDKTYKDNEERQDPQYFAEIMETIPVEKVLISAGEQDVGDAESGPEVPDPPETLVENTTLKEVLDNIIDAHKSEDYSN